MSDSGLMIPKSAWPKPGDRVELHNDQGYELEYMHECIGEKVTVKAVFTNSFSEIPVAAVEADNGMCGCFLLAMLRPVISEKEKTVEAMKNFLNCGPMSNSVEHAEQIAKAMYKAGFGYRKQEVK